MTVPIRSVLASGLLANSTMQASIRLTETRQTTAAGNGVSWISEPTVQVPFMQLPTLVPRYLSEAKEEQSCEKS